MNRRHRASFCVQRGSGRLYDEEADPCELHNLAPEPSAAPILAEMRERMARWMARVGDVMMEWNVDVTPM